jgi:hypothetical protein
MNAPQGSEAWALARCGFATASEFSAVLAKGKEGATRRKYLLRVVAERMTGKPMETYSGRHTERGQLQEPFAREAYEIETGVLVDQVGFIPHPKGLRAGCSPDGLINNDGGLECKSVIPTVQIVTVQRDGIPPEHRPQVFGNLWLTERVWWDFASFCPDMPEHLRLHVVRVFRDEEYIEHLAAEVANFLVEVDELQRKLMERHPVFQVDANSAASQP